MPREFGAQIVRRGGDRVGQVSRLMLDDERACLDPGHLDQIVEHAAQAARFALERGGGGGGTMFDREFVGGGNDGGERGLEIMANRGEQGRAQIVALFQRADLARLRLELQAFVRECGLTDQRREKYAFVRRDRVALPLARDAEHAEHAQSGLERVELPFACGERPAVAPRHFATIERPIGGGNVDGAKLGNVGCAGDYDMAPVSLAEQDGCNAEQRRDFLARRGRSAGLVRDRGEALAEGSERGVLGRGARTDIGFVPHLPGQLARDHGDNDEHQQRHDILRIGDRQRIERRQEEEIVRERRAEARDQGRAQTVKCRSGDDRQQIEQIDRIGSDERLHERRKGGVGCDEA